MNGVIHYAIFRLTLFIAEFSRCHGVLLFEVTREDAGVAESAGRGHLHGMGEVRLEQIHGYLTAYTVRLGSHYG